MKRLVSIMLICLVLVMPFPVKAARGDGVGTDLSGMQTVDLNGAPVDGSVFSERLFTVVNIWQRWCGPCMGELPFFKRLNEEYILPSEGMKGLMGALYYTRPSDIEDAIEFIAQEGYDWAQVLASDEILSVVTGEGGVSVPQTVIVDRFGIVRAQHRGGFSYYDELFGFVKPWEDILLAEALGDPDGDGEVTASDALLTLRMAMGLVPETAPYAADMDGSGTVDIGDALAILRIVLGIA